MELAFYCLRPMGQAMTEVVKGPEPVPMGRGLECKAILRLYPPGSPLAGFHQWGKAKAMGQVELDSVAVETS